MDTFDRVSVTVGLVLLALVLFLLVDLPARTFAFLPFGSPLAVQLSDQWLWALLAAGLAIAGTHSVVSAHPLAQDRQRWAGFAAWILPGAIGFLAPFLLSLATRLPSWYWLAGLGLTATLIASVMLLECYVADLDAPARSTADLALHVLTYVVALTAFVLIYRSRARSLVTATATAVVSAVMAFRLLRGSGRPMGRTALYAGLAGLVMGQSTWALNYWPIHALTGGGLLLLFFYVVVGVAQQHLQRSLTRRVVIEFLAVAVIGVWLLLRLGAPLGS
ncbi:MAG: hypothetical protein JSV36_18920 [Anaerolineae bacterium]|nr:MAG: hypothetical protein JSV36_18920 [Anaerolineae bacterium]